MVPSDIDQPFTVASEHKTVRYNGQQSCNAECVERVVEATRDARRGEDSDNGTDYADAFSAAIDAGRSPDESREATAPEEEAGAPVEDTPPYQAAFEAAKRRRVGRRGCEGGGRASRR